ncbi:MAG: 16S rRNA (cytidine(1402)-2'-O)-methyltransferase, partial [bacterium]
GNLTARGSESSPGNLTARGSESSNGKLTVCATPIGNLGDVSYRLLEALRDSDLILAEDTRRTRKLLAHYDIHVPLTCLEKHREAAMQPWVERKLQLGKRIALLSDAGTPGLADPGQQLIPALIHSGYEVDYIPGPSAILAALTLSGLPMHSFLFHAFPPAKTGPRRRLFLSLAMLKATLIFFESPFRLRSSLDDMRTSFGDRPAAICREMTKRYQEIWRGSLSSLQERLAQRKTPPLGEVTVVVGGSRDTAVENELTVEGSQC